MQSQVDQISQVLVEVTVEVPWERVSKGLEEAYKVLQQRAHVRGFRKGKVPRHVVKNLMGKQVKEDVASKLVQEGISEAIQTHELEIVAVPELGEPAITDGQPMSFKAKLEVRPKIEEVKTEGLEVERPTQEVTEEQVDEQIEQLRQQNADLAEVDPPRPAKDGDVLLIDIAVAVDGTERPEMASTDHRAELGEGALLPEIEAGLQGMQVGETKTVELTFSEEHNREELRGKPAALTLTVKEMREKQLPDVDDEFAKDLEHESLEALRAETRKQLEANAKRRAEALLKEAVVDALVDLNPIEVPPSMVRQQQQGMLRELFQLQQMLGQALPYDEDTHKAMEQRAERKVRAGLLFAEIARRQELEVADAEIDAKLAETAEQTGKHIAKVRAEYQGEALDDLRSQLLEQKLLEYLLSQATIRDPGESPPAKAKKKKAEAKTKADDADDAKEEEAEATPPKKKKAAAKKAEASAGGETGKKKAAKKSSGQTKKKGATPKKAKEADT